MYINILFIIIALVAIIAISKSSELSRAVKGFVITLFLLLIALAIFYEWMNSGVQKRIEPLVLSFKKGEDIICEGKRINAKSYIYESGTSLLFPKQGVVGKTYSISKCQRVK